MAVLTAGVAEHLLEPPVNVLRLALNPEGLAPRVVNLAEWRRRLLDRLRRQVVAGGDPALAALQRELETCPGAESALPHDRAASAIAVPLRLRNHHDRGELTFISTATTFGAAVDITVSELSIEAIFPADATTSQRLHVEDQLRPQ